MAKISKTRKKGYFLGTGAFKVVKYEDSEIKKLLLKKFDQYRDSNASIERLELWELNEEESIKLAQEGVIHDTSAFISQGTYKGNFIKKETGDSALTWLISINQVSKKLKNHNLRKCLNKQFPREEIIHSFLPDHRKAKGYLPPGLLSSSDIELSDQEVDCKGFEKESIVLDFPKEINDGLEICSLVKREVSFINIRCNELSFTNLLERIQNKTSELSFLAMTLDYPDVEYFFNTFESDSKFNLSNLKSKKIDNLLSKARHSIDRAERAKIYSEINQYLWDEVVTINLSYPRHISYSHKCVEGLDINVLGEAYIDYRNIELTRNCENKEHFDNESA